MLHFKVYKLGLQFPNTAPVFAWGTVPTLTEGVEAVIPFTVTDAEDVIDRTPAQAVLACSAVTLGGVSGVIDYVGTAGAVRSFTFTVTPVNSGSQTLTGTYTDTQSASHTDTQSENVIENGVHVTPTAAAISVVAENVTATFGALALTPTSAVVTVVAENVEIEVAIATIIRVATASGGSVKEYDSDGTLIDTIATSTTVLVGDLDIDNGLLYMANDTNTTNNPRTIDLATGTNTELGDDGQGIGVDDGAGYLYSGYSNSTLKRWNLGMTSASNIGTNEFDIRWIKLDRVNQVVVVGRTQASSTFRGLWVYPSYSAPETGTRIVNTSTIKDVRADADQSGVIWAINATSLFKVVNGALADTVTLPTGYNTIFQVLVDSGAGFAYVYGQQTSDADEVFDRYDFDGTNFTNKQQLLTGLSGAGDRFILRPA